MPPQEQQRHASGKRSGCRRRLADDLRAGCLQAPITQTATDC